MFNDGGYSLQAQRGDLRRALLKTRHPSPPRAREPPCTQSQIVAYLDVNGREVARVHQYLRPDGTRGASGRPDPKRLVVGGTLYVLDPTDG